jgi:hypothetical protein
MRYFSFEKPRCFCFEVKSVIAMKVTFRNDDGFVAVTLIAAPHLKWGKSFYEDVNVHKVCVFSHPLAWVATHRE